MPSHKAQIAVLGAGPAGAIAARHLGLAGADVVLIDPGVPAGGHVVESFPASGAPLADEIGVLAMMCEVSDGPSEALHMLWRDAPEVRAFEGEGPLLLRRHALRECLRDAAHAVVRPMCARVRDVTTTPDGAEVVTDADTVQCQMVIDARGRHATKRQATDLVALPFSASGTTPAYSMELEAASDGWIWACTLPGGEVHGALFQRASELAGLNAQDRETFAKRRLEASDIFANVADIQVGRPAAAGLSAVDDPVLAERHVLIGDAALARDPIASHGLVQAIRGGVQAAIAALTILDPAADTHAALSFLRHKHREAVDAAKLATQRAYADQSRFQTPFWAAPEPQELPVLPEITQATQQGPVMLTTPLTRAPVLESDRIRWAPAIELPATQDFMTGFGPVTAMDIAAACRPAAPLQEIATRLGRLHDMAAVFEALERLTLGGAFTQAPTAV